MNEATKLVKERLLAAIKAVGRLNEVIDRAEVANALRELRSLDMRLFAEDFKNYMIAEGILRAENS